MALLPIDLQTMYASLDKVSKLTGQKQQVEQLQTAIIQEELTKKVQEKAKTVEKSTMDDQGPMHVKDRQHGGNGSSASEKDQKFQKQETTENQQIFEQIKDPSLGQKIDISG